MKILAIIPARGGSKGIPRKNIKPLAHKPLIGWTIDAARNARGIDRLVVSTEDPEIAKTAEDLGADVPFMRPGSLAKDETSGIAPVLHAIEMLPGYDWVLLLQPTSPFRTAKDIENIIQMCSSSGAQSAVSICNVEKHPCWMYRLNEQKKLEAYEVERLNTFQRQQLPMLYVLNGALYMAQTDWLKKERSFIGADTLGYVMPHERSVDLDTLYDWKLAEYMISMQNGE